MKMRNRLAALLLCVSIGATLAACGNETKSIGASSSVQSASESEIADMINPWVDAKDQNDAQEQARFTIQLPSSLPAEYGAPSFQVIPDDMIEAYYVGTGEARLCVRKAVGTEDASGDYREYPESQQVTVDGLDVTMKGDNGVISLATWNDGTNAYSIGIYGGVGLSVEEMTQMVSEMME
jgi:hypothetical protein